MPTRRRPALTCVEHKAEIGAGNSLDDEIVGNVDEIGAILKSTLLNGVHR